MCNETEMKALKQRAEESTKKLFSSEKMKMIADEYIDKVIIGKDTSHKLVVVNSRQSGKNTWANIIKSRMIERGLV